MTRERGVRGRAVPGQAVPGQAVPDVVVLALVLLIAVGACSEPSSPDVTGAQVSGAPAQAGAVAGDAPAPWLREVARERGLLFEHRTGHREGSYLMPEIMGAGAGLFDMDADGDLDAYLVQSGSLYPDAGPNAPNQLFENRGGGQFREVTETHGAGDVGYGMGVACGDVDGDGDTDLYVTNLGPNALWLNDGTGHFSDVTATAGVGDPGWGSSAAFFDLEGDGDLDLYVVNYLNWKRTNELPCKNNMGAADYCSPRNYESPATDVVYRNRGDGSFEDCSSELGTDQLPGTGLGVVCADFDGDGLIEVFVANDGMPDFLWVPSLAEDGVLSWEESGLLRGCALDGDGVAKAGMGVDVDDIDGDGDPDLIVCNLHRESNSFYINEGSVFLDRTAAVGLGAASRPFTRFGLGWIDLDNDGWLDLYEANGRVMRHSHTWSQDPYAEPNQVYRGEPDGRFAVLAPRAGTARDHFATSRGAAFGDVDGDGGIDVLVGNLNEAAHLFLNVAPERGHWLVVDALDGGRRAIHARIELSDGSRKLVRELRAAASYQSSNDPRAYFGLGDRSEPCDVIVTWPGAQAGSAVRERFRELALDRIQILERGRGEAVR